VRSALAWDCTLSDFGWPLALQHEYAVLTMHWYQFFFVCRVVLVSFDYGFVMEQRHVDDLAHSQIVLSTVTFVAILILQLLNTLLVMAVIRIMRKRRRNVEKTTEATPLLQ